MMRRFAWCGNYIHILRRESNTCQRVVGRSCHALHGAFENLLSFKLPPHDTVEHTSVRVGAAHSLYSQSLACVGITSEFFGKETFLTLGGFEHHRRGAVAKQHGDIAIGPIHPRRRELRANDQRGSHHASANHRRGGREGV